MNWERAIEINREKLLVLLAGLLGMAGGMVTRTRRNGMLALLRPAEAAARRLIAIAARGMVVAPHLRAAPAGPIPAGSGARVPAFRLFDPRRAVLPAPVRPAGAGPRIRGFDEPFSPFSGKTPPARRAALPDDPVGTEAVHRRLAALRHALDTVPAQARRLARAMARHRLRLRAMRPGRPPGYRLRGRREVDRVLTECHQLALYALASPDTS